MDQHRKADLMARSTKTQLNRLPLVCQAAMAVGAVFLLVGILGFIPGITTDYDTMTFAGHESEAKLLGIFEVSVLHNLVHLLFGVLGLALARRADTARYFLIGGGAIYLILWLYGLVIDKNDSANFVPLNAADDWLHFVLGIGMIALGVLLTRSAASRINR
jgi:arginine exporter protein ArgO